MAEVVVNRAAAREAADQMPAVCLELFHAALLPRVLPGMPDGRGILLPCKAKQQAGKRPAQTVSNGCEYGF